MHTCYVRAREEVKGSMRLTVPKGCVGVEMRGGTKYDASRTGTVDLPDHHAARALANQKDLLGKPSTAIGTKAGRRCPGCRFLAQAWTRTCPRCGTTTVAERCEATFPYGLPDHWVKARCELPNGHDGSHDNRRYHLMWRLPH